MSARSDYTDDSASFSEASQLDKCDTVDSTGLTCLALASPHTVPPIQINTLKIYY